MIERHHILLATVSVAVVSWYAVGLVLFLGAAEQTLTKQSVAALHIVSWALLAVALFANIVWAVDLRTEAGAALRLSDGAWRTDVLLRLALSIAAFSVVIAVLFTDADGDLFEVDFADRRLLTPLTPYEATLCPVVLAPLYFFLFLFAAIGRSRGNAIKLRSL